MMVVGGYDKEMIWDEDEISPVILNLYVAVTQFTYGKLRHYVKS